MPAGEQANLCIFEKRNLVMLKAAIEQGGCVGLVGPTSEDGHLIGVAAVVKRYAHVQVGR
jgi:hypothetical protein